METAFDCTFLIIPNLCANRLQKGKKIQKLHYVPESFPSHNNQCHNVLSFLVLGIVLYAVSMILWALIWWPSSQTMVTSAKKWP